MFDRYYTTKQLQQLQETASAFGEEKMQAYQDEWQNLIDLVRAEKDKGAAPGDESVQLLAQRWKGLIEAFTGGDSGISKSLKQMYNEEGPDKATCGALDQSLSEYIGKAVANLDL